MTIEPLDAASINVPNASFELPLLNTVALPYIDSWQQIPEPPDLTSGVFSNGLGPGFIDNCDGIQAAFLYANPQIGFFQDYDSIDYTASPATHAFDAKFEAGKSYDLTVAVTGSLQFPVVNGSTLQVALYYRDANSNMVVVASTNVTYDSASFSSTHFRDFQAHLPTVKPSDAAAGQHIGISILSTVSSAGQGIWDIDNVRLSSTAILLSNPGFSGGHFSFTLQSEAGRKFEILATADPTLPVSSWTNLGTVTNVLGTLGVTDLDAPSVQLFYAAHLLP